MHRIQTGTARADRGPLETHGCYVNRCTKYTHKEFSAKHEWSTSVDVRCKLMAYWCRTAKLDDSKLASRRNSNTAWGLSCWDMSCNHSAGGRPSRWADSGTPIHSRNRGYTCMPNGESRLGNDRHPDSWWRDMGTRPAGRRSMDDPGSRRLVRCVKRSIPGGPV